MQGSFQKKGKKWYFILRVGEIDPKTGQKKPKWFPGGDSKREAQKKCAEFLASYDPATYVQPIKIKMNDYLDEWIETHVKHKLQPRSLMNYKQAVSKFKEWNQADILLVKFGKREMASFVHFMLSEGNKGKSGLAIKTIKNYATIIQSAIYYAFDVLRLIPSYPLGKLNLPEDPQKVKSLDEEEVARIFDDIENNIRKYTRSNNFARAWDWFIVQGLCYTMFYTGCRVGEALGLDDRLMTLTDGAESFLYIKRIAQDMPGQGVFLKDRPKTKSSERELPVGENLRIVIKRHILEMRKAQLQQGSAFQDNHLIFANRDGSPVSPKKITSMYKDMCKRLGINASPHVYRHTFATLLIRGGASINDVSKLLGHSKPSITLDIYAHSLPHSRRTIMNVMDAKISQR